MANQKNRIGRVMGHETAIAVSTNFPGGGGSVSIIQTEPVTLKIKPHNEGAGGWSQMWWYFQIEGCVPGEQIVLQLEGDDQDLSGISPKIYFSYDQRTWGLTNTGEDLKLGGRKMYSYKHNVRGNKAWFAYDLPYTSEHIENILIPRAKKDAKVDIFQLCKTRKDRTVHAFRFNNATQNSSYGVWLQARAHAFESGASWVLHELMLWLLSEDPQAVALRSVAVITVVPIVDVDGVMEGRTGKYQKPYDHWMNWHEDQHYWPEIRTIKSMLSNLAKQNMLDMFIDFHGPGSLTHPYFIIPESDSLPNEKQRVNRSNFFTVLGAEPMDDSAKKSQSMTRIHYSPRALNPSEPNSSEWVSLQTTDHNIAMTIEVNMNTPLSTQDGYRAEARVLGRAISKYFKGHSHVR